MLNKTENAEDYMKRFAFLVVLSVLMITVNSAFAIDVTSGKDYFLRTPLYASKDKDNQINWINYSDVAAKLRAGEKVTIIEIKGNVITLALGSKIFFFTFTQKDLAGTSGIYDKYFTSSDISEKINSYNERVRNNITLGRVEPGMTKEQVLLSAGCPAVAGLRKTYNLSLDDVLKTDSWIYYRSRMNKWIVRFADGKVSSIEE
jgi:hypothetical protein